MVCVNKLKTIGDGVIECILGLLMVLYMQYRY